MKVLQVNKYNWHKGGSETVYFRLSELLRAHGHEVIPFSMKDERNERSPYEKFFVENVDYDRGGISNKISSALKIIYSLDARNKIDALLNCVTPDVAHFHIFQHQISPSVFGPLRKRGIPTILTLHDLKPICPNYKMLTNGAVCEKCKGGRFYHCLVNRCTKDSYAKSLVNVIEMYLHYARGYYQEVSRYIAVSDFYRRKMIEFGFPAEQVVHIPNFVDVERFAENANGGCYCLYFGRLSEEKGLFTLLEAARKCPEIPLIIVGSGPLEAALQEKAAGDNIQNVTFAGFKTGKELQRIVGEARFTIIPSEWYENCPMSVLESLAMGKAVVGADIGGIPELITDGDDGLTFVPGDANSLAAAMRQLWTTPEKTREMGMAGREKVAKKYSPQKCFEKTMSLYRELLS